MYAKLKKHNLADMFMISESNDIPCLNEVEKKIKLCQYNSIHIFALDVRKIWKYYFSKASTNPNLYQNTFEISQYFEEIFNEAEETQIETQSLEQINNKLKKLESQIQMNEKKQMPVSNLYLGNTKSNVSTSKSPIPIAEKPMTITEKNILGNKIRMLSQEQMKGIINILSDQCSIDNNSKFFEFDIDTLTTKKLRDLEKYVKKCLKGSSTTSVPNTIPKSQQQQPQQHKVTEVEKAPIQKAPVKEEIKTPQQKEPQQVQKQQILVDSLTSSDDDSGSLSSLDFKKGR